VPFARDVKAGAAGAGFFSGAGEDHGRFLNAFVRADFNAGEPIQIESVVFLTQEY
jgi:hypothetical protein